MPKDLVKLNEKQLLMVSAGSYPSTPGNFFCSEFRHKPVTIEDFYQVAIHFRTDLKKLRILLHTNTQIVQKFMKKAKELGYSASETFSMLLLMDEFIKL